MRYSRLGLSLAFFFAATHARADGDAETAKPCTLHAPNWQMALKDFQMAADVMGVDTSQVVMAPMTSDAELKSHGLSPYFTAFSYLPHSWPNTSPKGMVVVSYHLFEIACNEEGVKFALAHELAHHRVGHLRKWDELLGTEFEAWRTKDNGGQMQMWFFKRRKDDPNGPEQKFMDAHPGGTVDPIDGDEEIKAHAQDDFVRANTSKFYPYTRQMEYEADAWARGKMADTNLSAKYYNCADATGFFTRLKNFLSNAGAPADPAHPTPDERIDFYCNHK